MYQPPSFREDRPAVLHALIRAYPLGTVITAGTGGLLANPIPFLIGEDGILRAHVAKGNDQIPALREGAETLVIFQGPQAYVTPAWYASKAEHGKVVPTWNYAVVQARGTPRVIDDPAWLRSQVDAVTGGQEASRAAPWEVADAPAPFVESQLRGIVGVEIHGVVLEGKWKVSQNRSEPDRRGVAAGLGASRDHDAMAQLVMQGGAEPPRT